MGKLSSFQIMNFTHSLCLFQVLSTIKQTRVSCSRSVRKAAIRPTRNLKTAYAILLDINHGIHNTKISVYLGANQDSADDAKRIG